MPPEPIRKVCYGNSNEDTRDIHHVFDRDHPVNVILIGEGSLYSPKIMNSEMELAPCSYADGHGKDRCCANREKIGYCYWVRGR